ncbi:MAG TPA: hypothetical protein VMV49_15910 [Candidatus Deferrimicrobium sp.]|nr:hypothetical protein [Candidatus Deferrimicrobium sp.]
MNKVNLTGGIIVLIGGFFILLQAIFFLPTYIPGTIAESTGWIINFIMSILAILTGIIGIVGKKFGDILALFIGIHILIFGVLTVEVFSTACVNPYPLWPYSFFTSTLHLFSEPAHLIFGISLEGLLVLGGSLVLLSSGSTIDTSSSRSKKKKGD